jgi:2-iminobutanoate/2-iminopropanoate deaminase
MRVEAIAAAEERGMSEKKRQEIRVDRLSEPLSHYTDAVRWGDMLFVSGVAPLDREGRLVGDDAAAQTRQIFENMKLILDAAGTNFREVLRVTVYLTDVDDRKAINPIRQEYFGDVLPASTLIEVAGLAVPGMKVEIEAVFGVPGR